jgi:hypothetical protein
MRSPNLALLLFLAVHVHINIKYQGEALRADED